MQDPIPLKPRGNPNMRVGAPSVNPHGRPKRGDALAERVRALADPDHLIAFLLDVISNPACRMSDKLAAAEQLLSRGWGRAVQPSELTIDRGDELPPAWDAMTSAEREAWLARYVEAS